MAEFAKDVEQIRQRAIRNIEDGAVTSAYQVDKERSIAILNEALATEIVCVLRYMHHYFMATGVHGKSVASEFKEHADAERDHADQIGERIQQLGGKPDFNPGTLVGRSIAQYVEGETLADMIREDLIAERSVIDVYSQMIRFFGDKDPTTRVMIEGILQDEEEHANDLVDLLYIVEPSTGETEGVDPGTHPLDLHGGGRAAGRPQIASRRVSGEMPGESRPARATGPQRPDESSAAPEHQPGATGRPARQHPQQMEEVEVDEQSDEGAQTGTSRAVRVTRPNRKKRIA
jgi:bacterioferritin